VTEAPADTPSNRAALGLVLIVVGLVFALSGSDEMPTKSLSRWWPLLLLGVGAVKMRQPREDGQRAAGVAFLLFGGLFQFASVLTSGSTWTLLMVGIGVFLVWRGVHGPAARDAATLSESPYLSDMVLIGYVKRSHPSPNLRGGAVTVVMGGLELDLRKAVLAGGTAYLDVVAVWGGIDIKVPPGWAIDGRVVPVMGAFENKVDSSLSSGSPRLVVRGHAIMGAVLIGP
jgi:hypothetical protein